MPDVAKLKETLEQKFAYLAGKVTTPRERRVFVEVPAENCREVLEHLKNELAFGQCCTITGSDDKDTLGVMYHLAHDDGTLCSVRQHVPRESPEIKSVCDLYPSCANYERELVDLLGFKVENLPPGKRYPMPDNFPTDQHPLRKDWQPAK